MDYELPTEDNIKYNRVWHSDFQGVYVQILDIIKGTEKPTIIVSWNNETDYSVMYGEMFWIERLENGEWVDCSLKDNYFATIGYPLETNKSTIKEYGFEDMYDVSKSGTYRFRSTFNITIGNEQPAKYYVWSEFVIE